MSENNDIVHVTNESFEQEVLQSDMPVLIDYWAEWCGPCKSIAPVLEEVAGEYRGKIKVAKLNVDDYGEKAAEYAIRSIPTLMLFKNGSVQETRVGVLSKPQLTALFDENL